MLLLNQYRLHDRNIDNVAPWNRNESIDGILISSMSPREEKKKLRVPVRRLFLQN